MPPIATSTPDRMDTKRAAAYLGLAPITVEKMRQSGRGPRYLRIGGRVFYRASDLDSYIERAVVETADSRAA